jgi:hypothetical protein
MEYIIFVYFPVVEDNVCIYCITLTEWQSDKMEKIL